MENCDQIQQSLRWCKGKRVIPGLQKRVYFVSKDKIVVWPQLPTDNNGNPTSAILQGDFVLAANAVFDVIDILADKSTLVPESQGEKPSETYLNKCTLVHPEVDENATLFATLASNSDYVFIIPTASGKYRVLGCQAYETNVKVSQDQGQGATGTAGTTISIEASDIAPAPYYEGEIVTADGIINETVTHTVSISCTTGDGTVTIDSETPSTSVTKTIKHGRTITITATPATGKTFTKWSDDNINAVRYVTIVGDLTLTATFAAE